VARTKFMQEGVDAVVELFTDDAPAPAPAAQPPPAKRRRRRAVSDVTAEAAAARAATRACAVEAGERRALRDDARKALEAWAQEYGSSYQRLRHAVTWLECAKGITPPADNAAQDAAQAAAQAAAQEAAQATARICAAADAAERKLEVASGGGVGVVDHGDGFDDDEWEGEGDDDDDDEWVGERVVVAGNAAAAYAVAADPEAAAAIANAAEQLRAHARQLDTWMTALNAGGEAWHEAHERAAALATRVNAVLRSCEDVCEDVQ